MSDENSENQGWEYRALQAAANALKAHDDKKKLTARVAGLLRAFYVMFNDMQQKLPPGKCELEFHEDRITFILGGIPLTVIYLKDDKPMFVEINKRPVLTERMYICNRNFGSGGDTSESPIDYEVGSIFIAEELYLVRWEGKIDVWSAEQELIDALLNSYYSIQVKHRDRDGNEIQISSDAWLYGQKKVQDVGEEDPGEIHIPIPGAQFYQIPKTR